MSKTNSFLAVYFLVICFFIAGANGVSAQDSVVFYDFREYLDEKPKLAAGEERNLLHRLFPKYLKRGQRCDEGTEFTTTEEDVKAGQFRPEVESVVHGSFTKAGFRETAYLISMGECHVARFWTYRLVIISGNQLIIHQNVPANSIRKVSDLDGDGIQELLIEGGGTGAGGSETNARLVSLSQGRFQVLKDFHEVVVDSCSQGRPEDEILAAVITSRPKGPGILPEFQAVNYEAKCPAEGAKASFHTTTKTLN